MRMDEDSSGFWKSYLNYLWDNEGGLFLFQCNYDVNQINISSVLFIREIVDPNNVYEYIIWNNNEIKIDSESVFYKHHFNMNIKHTNDPLFDKSNIESFNVLRSEGLTRSIFLVWTGLRQSVPLTSDSVLSFYSTEHELGKTFHLLNDITKTRKSKLRPAY